MTDRTIVTQQQFKEFVRLGIDPNRMMVQRPLPIDMPKKEALWVRVKKVPKKWALRVARFVGV